MKAMKLMLSLALTSLFAFAVMGCTEQQQLENEVRDVQEQREQVREAEENAIDNINEEQRQLEEEKQDVQEERTDDLP